MSYKYLENPIVISGILFEKEELDLWIENFRKKEKSIFEGMKVSSEAEIENILYSFSKEYEKNFELRFNCKISISKTILPGCYQTMPAYITFV